MRYAFIVALLTALYTPMLFSQSNCHELFGSITKTFFQSYSANKQDNIKIRTGVSNIDTELSEFPITVLPKYVDDYNDAISKRKRVRNPTRGGFPGLGTRENSTYLLAQNFNKILSGILTDFENQLSTNTKYFIKALLELHRNGLTIEVSDNPNEFKTRGGQPRIAKTTGNIGEPIIINSTMLQKFDIFLESIPELKGLEMPFHVDGTPYLSMRFPTLNDAKNGLDQQASTHTLRSIFSILVHEAGHYLKIPDSPSNPLDTYASEISRFFTEYIEEIDLKLPNHSWIKFIKLSFGKSKENPLLLLFDTVAIYDLSDQLISLVKKELNISFSKYWLVNCHWEAPHSGDLYFYTAPNVLALDVLVETPQGKKLVRTRVVNFFGPSNNGGWHPNVTPSNPWDWVLVSLATQESAKAVQIQILKDKVMPIESPYQEPSTNEILYRKDKIKSGETWHTSVRLVNTYKMPPKDATVFFSKRNSINSGFIKASKVAFTKNRVELLGSNEMFIHSEFLTPIKMKTGDYYVSRVILNFSDSTQIVYQPNAIQYVNILGQDSSAKLLRSGTPYAMIEPPDHPGPRPRQVLNAFEMKALPVGGILPLIFRFKELAKPKRISLHGRVVFKDKSQFQHVAGLNLKVLGGPIDPMIDSFAFVGDQSGTELKIEFHIPKSINKKKVEIIYIDSIYVQDENFDEVFSPCPIAIGMDVEE